MLKSKKEISIERPTSSCLYMQRIKDAYDNTIIFNDNRKVFIYALDDVILFSNTQVRGTKKKATGFESLKGEEICHIDEKYLSQDDADKRMPFIMSLYGERGIYHVMEVGDDYLHCWAKPGVITLDTVFTRVSTPAASITEVKLKDGTIEKIKKVKEIVDYLLSEKTNE